MAEYCVNNAILRANPFTPGLIRKPAPIVGGQGRCRGKRVLELCRSGCDYHGRQLWDVYDHLRGGYAAAWPEFPTHDFERATHFVEYGNACYAEKVSLL